MVEYGALVMGKNLFVSDQYNYFHCPHQRAWSWYYDHWICLFNSIWNKQHETWKLEKGTRDFLCHMENFQDALGCWEGQKCPTQFILYRDFLGDEGRRSHLECVEHLETQGSKGWRPALLTWQNMTSPVELLYGYELDTNLHAFTS